MKSLTKYNISPEYIRIPHFNKDISNMTFDDIELDTPVQFPLECYEEEKIDGASMGISWYKDGPILRNRNHILNKGFSKIRTPAKEQFKSAWNYVHDHKDDIIKVSEILDSPVTIYGEWMFAKHSIYYDKLPSLFIAYDIWSVLDNKFLSPVRVNSILSETNINYIKSNKCILNSINDVIHLSELPSNYRNGVREGIVIKIPDKENMYCEKSFKVVNKFFERREDFNDELIKNLLNG